MKSSFELLWEIVHSNISYVLRVKDLTLFTPCISNPSILLTFFKRVSFILIVHIFIFSSSSTFGTDSNICESLHLVQIVNYICFMPIIVYRNRSLKSQLNKSPVPLRWRRRRMYICPAIDRDFLRPQRWKTEGSLPGVRYEFQSVTLLAIGSWGEMSNKSFLCTPF